MFKLDKRITTQFVYFDISKAFDRVWHLIVYGLLLKLESIGVRGKLVNWFQNHLTDRTQAVVIKGEKSSEKKIPAGVPPSARTPARTHARIHATSTHQSGVYSK